ncbi:MAG: hypothetical protein M0R80_12235 [Proteobacteria bacterium]|nr:hypothetical protein [Pseudomonadota bacterium]
MDSSRRCAMLVVSILLLATAEALAADGGAVDAGVVDAGTDGGTDTDTDACDGACVEEFYNECACGTDDPCGWAGDGVCDEACVLQGHVDEMFDDSADCDPVPDGGTDTDTDTDADTDTSTDTDFDASTDGASASACTCAAIGGGTPSGLLASLLRLF